VFLVTIVFLEDLKKRKNLLIDHEVISPDVIILFDFFELFAKFDLPPLVHSPDPLKMVENFVRLG
jgi:hypothetical protein